MRLNGKILSFKVLCTGITVCAFCASLMSLSPDDFAGLDSRGIASKIASDCRPKQYPVSSAEIRQAVAEYARNNDGNFNDYFSNRSVSAISTLSLLPVAPASWWDKQSSDYQYIAFDLNNIVPANNEVDAVRSDWPPGIVVNPTYENGFWKSGIGIIDGEETNFYEPADCYKGDFARIYMYMAAVYPQPLWHGRGIMIYIDGGYPLINRYGRETLLKWHRQDPVDSDELQRNAVIASRQGTGNPFVELPLLAEYIWGDRSGEKFDPSSDPDPGTDPGDEPPTDPRPEPILLKAVYSKSADRRIDFRSPHIAAGSQWTFDGKNVDGQSLNLENINLGRHEIGFSNDNSRGKIIITIEP